jgi:protein-tyrosine phosphatase
MKILMVCLGNICRSPLAEGIMRDLLDGSAHEIDSAGTSSFHEGERPDSRMLRTARKYGVSMNGIRSRGLKAEDFDRFDRIYVMDQSNLQNVLLIARNDEDRAKVELLLNASHPGEDREVPDPYYGGEEGFDQVHLMILEACQKIKDRL